MTKGESILYDLTSQVTGGLVDDVYTAVLAFLCLLLIVYGFRRISEAIGEGIETRRAEHNEERDYDEYVQRRQRSEKFARTYDAQYGGGFVGPSPRHNDGGLGL